jgi:hypothetical protein
MRTLAAAGMFLMLLALACLFAWLPSEFVVALWLVPGLVGATAAVCSRKWGLQAIAVGGAVLLAPAAAPIFLLRTTGGVKMALVLAMVVSIPFLGAIVMTRLANPMEPKDKGGEL